MRVDIAGDRLPIYDGNKIIIIQKQKPFRARVEPTFGFYSQGAQ